MESTVGCVQILINKSQAPLSAGSWQFFSLQIALINFSEERCRELIASERTVVRYLPVIFEDRKEPTHQNSFGNAESRFFSKVNKLRATHKSVESCLKLLQIVAKAKLLVATKDGQKLLLHHLLVSYYTDLPDTEGPLGMK